jgi:hypothetical protein
VVTPTVLITTTPLPENTPALQTISTVTVQTVAPQPGMELLLVQQQAYLEEQQAWIRARQIDAELQVAQHEDELISEQAALDTQLTELHQCKTTLGTERAATIDFTKARSRARAVGAAINHEGMPCPTFARDSGGFGHFFRALHRWHG